MALIDVRIPADPADRQTTDAKSALPPVEFTASKGATANILTILDRQKVQDRASTVAYRIYFLPAAFAPTSTGTTATVPSPVVFSTGVRKAGRKVASLVTEVKAPGLGTNLSVTDTVNFNQKGFYYCVAVNRAEVEAPPEQMVKAP
jgi:hypothetical protein